MGVAPSAARHGSNGARINGGNTTYVAPLPPSRHHFGTGAGSTKGGAGRHRQRRRRYWRTRVWGVVIELRTSSPSSSLWAPRRGRGRGAGGRVSQATRPARARRRGGDDRAAYLLAIFFAVGATAGSRPRRGWLCFTNDTASTRAVAGRRRRSMTLNMLWRALGAAVG